MKALVIGGTGPTGPFIIEGLLQRGYQVSIFHRGTHEVPLPREVEHLHGDPHFAETIEETLGSRTFEVVIALYGRLRYVTEAMKKRAKRFLSVGGAGVYQASQVKENALVPLTEESPLQTDPDFHKFSYLMWLSEQGVMEAHRQGHYVATHFRYCWIHGPRALAPKEWCLVRRVLDGRKQLILPCGGLTLQARAYTENAAQAVLLAVDNPQASAGQIYNVSDDRVFSLREWAEIIMEAAGRKLELVDMPYAWARPSYPYMERLPHRVLSTAKIKSQLGYKDVVPAEEGLRRTVAWLLENRPEPGGATEKALADPFDYAAEDQLTEEYRRAEPKILAVPVASFVHRHPYAHPKRPGE